jgi:hypothetical protein
MVNIFMEKLKEEIFNQKEKRAIEDRQMKWCDKYIII